MSLLFRFFITLFFISGFSLHGQDELDSLKAIASNNNLHDTIRLKSIVQIINGTDGEERDNYFNILGETSKKNYQKSSGDLKKFYASYLASYYNEMGSRYNQIGLKKALEYTEKAIELCRFIDNESDLNFCIIGRGSILHQAGNYNEAINNYFEALRYFESEKEKDINAISYIYGHIATVYDSQKEYETSIKYLKKAIHYHNQLPVTISNDIQKCQYLMNIGTSYQKLRKYDHAKQYFKEAETISNRIGYDSYTSIALTKQGILEYEQGHLQEAKEKLEKACQLADDGLSESYASIHLGKVLHIQKNNNEALNYVKKGIAIVEEIQRHDLRLEAYELLFLIYKENGDYKSSLQYFEQHQNLKDSIETQENSYLLKKKELEYDYEKKELALKIKAEKENAKKNYLLLGLATLLLISLTVAYFRYRNYKQKQAIANFEKRELNQKLLLSRMNPHFIFNALNSIQRVYVEGNTEKANDFMADFAQLMRKVLENSGNSKTTLQEELNTLRLYMDLERLRCKDRFTYNITIDENISVFEVQIPPLIIQPFVENAIWHGILPLTDRNGEINISLQQNSDNDILISVSDNGVGFYSNDKSNGHSSRGIEITEQRIRDKVTVESEKGKGTTITFTVKTAP